MGPKSIEIGSTFITKQGAMIHVVHFVDKRELEIFQSQISNNLTVTSHFYTKQLYGALRNDITKVFRAHFDLNDDFEVIYYDFIDRKKRMMANFDVDDNSNDYDEDERGINNNPVLQKMITHTKLHLVDNEANKSQIQS